MGLGLKHTKNEMRDSVEYREGTLKKDHSWGETAVKQVVRQSVGNSTYLLYNGPARR